MKICQYSTLLVILLISLSSCTSARYPNPPTPASLHGEISGTAHFPSEMKEWKYPENVLVVLDAKETVAIVLSFPPRFWKPLASAVDQEQTYVFKYHKIANHTGPPTILLIKDKAGNVIYSERNGIHNKTSGGDVQ